MNKILLFGSTTLLVLIGLAKSSLSQSYLPQEDFNISQFVQDSKSNSFRKQSNFKLLDLGSQPRQVLKFVPQVPSQQTSKMTMKTDITMSVDSEVDREIMPQKITSPSTEIIIALTVNQIDSKGYIYTKFIYSDVEILADGNTPPELVDIFRSQMSQLNGINGSWIIDERGNTKDIQFNFPNNFNAEMQKTIKQLQNSLTQLSFPFPAEPVGIGAKWQITNILKLNDIDVVQLATYQLLSQENNKIILEIKIEQQAKPQTKIITFPQLPTNTSANFISLNGNGVGKVEINLDKIMPVRGNISMKSTMLIQLKNDSFALEKIIKTDTNTLVKLEEL